MTNINYPAFFYYIYFSAIIFFRNSVYLGEFIYNNNLTEVIKISRGAYDSLMKKVLMAGIGVIQHKSLFLDKIRFI